VASCAAAAALGIIAPLLIVPEFVNVGFLGWLAWPTVVRLALHLPLALALLTAGLFAMLVLGAVRRCWSPRLRHSM